MSSRGLAFFGTPAVPQMVELAQRAENLGYDSIWATETRFTRDGLIPCAAIAQATARVQIGTLVVNSYTRGAVLLAVSFATLDELAGARAIVGLGPGSPKILAGQGYDFDGPLTRMREYIEVMRLLLRHEQVDYDGEYVQVNGVRLDFEPVRSDPPFWLGVTGPKALELAGEMADGVVYNGFMPEAYYKRAKKRLEAGHARSGRSGETFQRAAVVACSVDTDRKVARDRARALVATYLVTFPNIAQETGYPEEALEELRAVFAEQGVEKAAGMVDDEWVDALTVAGEPDECGERLQRYYGWGIHQPIVAPIANAELAVDTFAPERTG